MKKISIDTLLRTGLSVEEIRELLLLVGGENTRVEILSDDESAENSVPEGESVEPIGEILVKRGDLTPEALDKGLKKHKLIGQELVEEGLVSPDKVASALAEQNRQKEALARKVKVEKISTIRVASDKLDRLFNLIGELVTVQERLSQVSGVIRKAQPGELEQVLQEFDLEGISEEVSL